MTNHDDKKKGIHLSDAVEDDLFSDDNFAEKMMFAIAHTVAAQENPSVDILHKTVMEEFGQPASPELVEFFKKNMKAQADEKARLKKHVGDSALQLVRKIVTGAEPTIEKLHQIFLETRNEKAPSPIIAFFKAELKKKGITKAGVKVATGKSKVALVRKVAGSSEPTMEKLKAAFSKEFGILVPAELVPVFQMELQKKEAKKRGITLGQYLVEETKKKLAKKKAG